jgi:hypothetical protein
MYSRANMVDLELDNEISGIFNDIHHHNLKCERQVFASLLLPYKDGNLAAMLLAQKLSERAPENR